MENKRKRGRPRKVVSPQTTYKRNALFWALSKCTDIVERRFRKLEALQHAASGNADMIAKLWN